MSSRVITRMAEAFAIICAGALKEARDEALEEAARLAEVFEEDEPGEMAIAIRALKEKDT